jgi:endonuclease/exonuclease/phosphatase family metal-dependent hydrolase
LPSFGEARGAIVVELTIARQRLRFVAMHLGLLGSWRSRQAAALLKRMSAFETRLPTVMLGDLNEWYSGGASLAHFAREHHVASPGLTFPSRLPLLPLDKIIINPDLRLVESGVHDTPLARTASDHLPIWARLTVVRPNSHMVEPEHTES